MRRSPRIKMQGGGNVVSFIKSEFEKTKSNQKSPDEVIQEVSSIADKKIKDIDLKFKEETGCEPVMIGKKSANGYVIKFCLDANRDLTGWHCGECHVVKLPQRPSEASRVMLTEEYTVTRALQEKLDKKSREHVVLTDPTTPFNSSFIVLELLKPALPGISTLSDVIDWSLGSKSVDASPLTKCEFLAILGQIFGTLSGARAIFKGFQHNDLHTDNVMLVPNSPSTWPNIGRFCAKIIDFGQATSQVREINTKEGLDIWGHGKWLDNPNQDVVRVLCGIYYKVVYAEKQGRVVPEFLIEFARSIEKAYNQPNPNNEKKLARTFEDGGLHGFPTWFETSDRWYRENMSKVDPSMTYQSLTAQAKTIC